VNVNFAPLVGAVGVPVMTPVEAFNESPLGKAPLVTDHEYGGVPPIALRVVE
jgi:hypothetical protein